MREDQALGRSRGGFSTRIHLKKANRQTARAHGICPAIPYRSTTKNQPTFFPRALYRGRARIEQTMGKLKRFKRVALRCEKTDESYGSFIALALSFILIKSVHTT